MRARSVGRRRPGLPTAPSSATEAFLLASVPAAGVATTATAFWCYSSQNSCPRSEQLANMLALGLSIRSVQQSSWRLLCYAGSVGGSCIHARCGSFAHVRAPPTAQHAGVLPPSPVPAAAGCHCPSGAAAWSACCLRGSGPAKLQQSRHQMLPRGIYCER